jgi:hypothetical protein
MKLFLIALVLTFCLTMPSYADNSSETRKICVNLQDKNGQPIINPKTNTPKQECKEVKVHKKYEATKIEDVNKDTKK